MSKRKYEVTVQVRGKAEKMLVEYAISLLLGKSAELFDPACNPIETMPETIETYLSRGFWAKNSYS